MAETEQGIATHYGRPELYDRILTALSASGLDTSNLVVEDLAPIDQFHSGGLQATHELAEIGGLRSGQRVLDAGCGIGGPARVLASQYGCDVYGIDLSREFVAAAKKLNHLLDMDDRVRCEVADVTVTGYTDESFDTVWSQNVLMNVPDKAAALTEAWRLLKPQGRFLVQCVMLGKPGHFEYPVMWASDPDLNFLVSPSEFQDMTESAGFVISAWTEDEGGKVRQQRNSAQRTAKGLDFSVIMDFPDYEAARRATAQNMEAGVAVPVSAVLVKK